MRLLPLLPGLLLVTTMAGAQPANYNAGPGPGYDPNQQPTQGAPPEAAPPPGAGPEAGPGGQEARPGGARHQHAKLKDRFEAANTSHDGRLTLDQAKQGHIGMIARNFDAIDADHKGYVTMQDVHAWHRARHQAKMAQQAQPQPQ